MMMDYGAQNAKWVERSNSGIFYSFFFSPRLPVHKMRQHDGRKNSSLAFARSKLPPPPRRRTAAAPPPPRRCGDVGRRRDVAPHVDAAPQSFPAPSPRARSPRPRRAARGRETCTPRGYASRATSAGTFAAFAGVATATCPRAPGARTDPFEKTASAPRTTSDALASSVEAWGGGGSRRRRGYDVDGSHADAQWRERRSPGGDDVVLQCAGIKNGSHGRRGDVDRL